MKNQKFRYGFLEAGAKSSPVLISSKLNTNNEKTLYIYNHGFKPDSIDISFSYSAADSDGILITPSQFELAGGDSQAITIRIIPSLLGSGSFFTRLIVDSRFGPFITHWEKPINFAILTNLEERGTNLPLDFCLFQNYPNPFNPVTVINYQLSVINDVDLSIFNIRGQKVTTLVHERQRADK